MAHPAAEAAMAGALGLALGGPRNYVGSKTDGPSLDPWLGTGRSAATAHDIRTALRLYAVADALLIALIAIVATISVLL